MKGVQRNSRIERNDALISELLWDCESCNVIQYGCEDFPLICCQLGLSRIVLSCLLTHVRETKFHLPILRSSYSKYSGILCRDTCLLLHRGFRESRKSILASEVSLHIFRLKQGLDLGNGFTFSFSSLGRVAMKELSSSNAFSGLA